jgi:hypothetical protein
LHRENPGSRGVVICSSTPSVAPFARRYMAKRQIAHR